MFSLIDITPTPVTNPDVYPPEAFRVSLEDGVIGQELLKALDSDHKTVAVLAVLDEHGLPLPGYSHYCAPSCGGYVAWIHVLRDEDVEEAQRKALVQTDAAYPNHLVTATVMIALTTGELTISRKYELTNCSLILNIQSRDRRHV